MMPSEVSPKDAAPESTRGARRASALAVRRLFKGVLLYSSANFGSTAIGFVTIMVLTRALSPSDFGVVALAETTAALVGTIGAAGLPIAYSRLAFRSRTASKAEASPAGSNEVGVAVSRLLITSLRITALVLGCAALAVARFAPLVVSRTLLSSSVVACATSLLGQYGQFGLRHLQAIERPSRYALARLAGVCAASLGAILLVNFLGLGTMGVLAARLGGAMVALGSMWSVLSPMLGRRASGARAQGVLRFAWPLGMYEVAVFTLEAGDRYFIRAFLDESSVGIYALAYAFATAMSIIASAVLGAWHPLYYQLAAKNDLRELGRVEVGLKESLALIALLGILVSPDVTAWVLPPSYHAVSRVCPVIIGGLYFYSLLGLDQLALLHVERTRPIALIAGFAVLLNGALNVWLVPVLGIQGAALATLLTYFSQSLAIRVLSELAFRRPQAYLRQLVGPILVALALWLAAGSSLSVRLGLTLIVALVGGQVVRGVLREMAHARAAPSPSQPAT